MYDLAFSSGGRLPASVDGGGELIVWYVESRFQFLCLEAHEGAGRGVTFTPDDTMLITIGDDDKMQVWGVEPD